uniref:Fucosyltransferase n=1 Tax=Oryza barthii TaxID=65489 RepID=A0A0D3HAR7_9ORYZ
MLQQVGVIPVLPEPGPTTISAPRHTAADARGAPETESYNRGVQRLKDGSGKGSATEADARCGCSRATSPLVSYANFSADTAESYGNMMKNKVLGTDGSDGDMPAAQMPAFAYLHLNHDYGDDDKMFFCDDDQRLVMRTDTYIVPSLFLVTRFQDELDALFPERGAVFHYLGRYLFPQANHTAVLQRVPRAGVAAAGRRPDCGSQALFCSSAAAAEDDTLTCAKPWRDVQSYVSLNRAKAALKGSYSPRGQEGWIWWSIESSLNQVAKEPKRRKGKDTGCARRGNRSRRCMEIRGGEGGEGD